MKKMPTRLLVLAISLLLSLSVFPMTLSANASAAYIPGDVTGEGKINPLDLVKLSQYISDGCTTDPNGYNVILNEAAGDVDNNGRLAPLDLVLISRYISDGCVTDPDGYNVTLLPSDKFGQTPEERAFYEKKAEILAYATWAKGGYRYNESTSITAAGKTLISQIATTFHSTWSGLEYSDTALESLNTAYEKYKSDVDAAFNKYPAGEWTKPIK